LNLKSGKLRISGQVGKVLLYTMRHAMMVPIKVCNAPQIFTHDLRGLPPNLVRFVTLSDYLGMVGYHAKPHAPGQKKSPVATHFEFPLALVVLVLTDDYRDGRGAATSCTKQLTGSIKVRSQASIR
jgi:hypothetical protein